MDDETKNALDKMSDIDFLNVFRDCVLGFGPLDTRGRKKNKTIESNDKSNDERIHIADSWGSVTAADIKI